MRRFPKCPLIPVFVSSEIVSESQSDDGSVLLTERRCVIDIDAPRLLKRVPLMNLLNRGGQEIITAVARLRLFIEMKKVMFVYTVSGWQSLCLAVKFGRLHD